ncbi:MAG: hypothetical protein KGY80_09980 [Candidatus Thorarchaeota archaeon]|nr:hypothetical protein [Candidatus Thorarchaeota archaeon]
MSTGKTLQTQIHVGPVEGRESTSLFTPPGILIESRKYPTVIASVLASSSPSEHLSLFDHPECWGGLDKHTILSMRRHLYQLEVPLNARRMEPCETVKKIQEIALSVSPVAVQIKSNGLPPSNLVTKPGQLPSGAEVSVDSLELVSDPQISKVAEAITQKDIPAAEGVWQLLEYEYSLDQAARLMAVGLLGRIKNRRIITTRGAYKAAIDAFINRTLVELAEKPVINGRTVFSSDVFDDKFTILLRPGEPAVDYFRMDMKPSSTTQGYSLERDNGGASDAKSSLYADHARYSAYRHLLTNQLKAHITIFHSSTTPRNSILGPWIAREGVKKALSLEPSRVALGQTDSELLKGVLSPSPKVWESSLPLSIFDDAIETVPIVA